MCVTNFLLDYAINLAWARSQLLGMPDHRRLLGCNRGCWVTYRECVLGKQRCPRPTGTGYRELRSKAEAGLGLPVVAGTGVGHLKNLLTGSSTKETDVWSMQLKCQCWVAEFEEAALLPLFPPRVSPRGIRVDQCIVWSKAPSQLLSQGPRRGSASVGAGGPRCGMETS